MNQHGATERRPETYQDVLDAPEHKLAELIDGVLYLSPRPEPRVAYVKHEEVALPPFEAVAFPLFVLWPD